LLHCAEGQPLLQPASQPGLMHYDFTKHASN
jgi:hypothetical protein